MDRVILFLTILIHYSYVADVRQLVTGNVFVVDNTEGACYSYKLLVRPHSSFVNSLTQLIQLFGLGGVTPFLKSKVVGELAVLHQFSRVFLKH